MAYCWWMVVVALREVHGTEIAEEMASEVVKGWAVSAEWLCAMAHMVVSNSRPPGASGAAGSPAPTAAAGSPAPPAKGAAGS